MDLKDFLAFITRKKERETNKLYHKYVDELRERVLFPFVGEVYCSNRKIDEWQISHFKWWYQFKDNDIKETCPDGNLLIENEEIARQWFKIEDVVFYDEVHQAKRNKILSKLNKNKEK